MGRHIGRLSMDRRTVAERLGFPGGEVIFCQTGYHDVLLTIEHESMPELVDGEMVPVVEWNEEENHG